MTLGVARASRALVLAACFVVLGAACQGTSEQTRFRESLPAFEDVEMVAVGLYPMVEKPALPLTPEDNGERIRWILGQLKRAPLSGLKAHDSGAALGHVSPSFQILPRDEQPSLLLVPALDCRDDRNGEFCVVSPRNVVVFLGSRATRLVAPELAGWMANGWESEVTRGSPEELAALMMRRFPTPPVPRADPVRMWVDQPKGSAQVALPLISGRGNDAEVMRRVANWLRSASPGSPDTESDVLFFGPPFPVIEISWGDFGITVRAAWNCGVTASCTRSSDEVIVEDGRPFRGPYHLRSPELAGWLASGYLQDMRMGTYEEYEREAHW